MLCRQCQQTQSADETKRAMLLRASSFYNSRGEMAGVAAAMIAEIAQIDAKWHNVQSCAHSDTEAESSIKVESRANESTTESTVIWEYSGKLE